MNGDSYCLKAVSTYYQLSLFCQEMYTNIHALQFQTFPGKLASYPVSNDMNDTSNYLAKSGKDVILLFLPY